MNRPYDSCHVSGAVPPSVGMNANILLQNSAMALDINSPNNIAPAVWGASSKAEMQSPFSQVSENFLSSNTQESPCGTTAEAPGSMKMQQLTSLLSSLACARSHPGWGGVAGTVMVHSASPSATALPQQQEMACTPNSNVEVKTSSAGGYTKAALSPEFAVTRQSVSQQGFGNTSANASSGSHSVETRATMPFHLDKVHIVSGSNFVPNSGASPSRDATYAGAPLALQSSKRLPEGMGPTTPTTLSCASLTSLHIGCSTSAASRSCVSEASTGPSYSMGHSSVTALRDADVRHWVPSDTQTFMTHRQLVECQNSQQMPFPGTVMMATDGDGMGSMAMAAPPPSSSLGAQPGVDRMIFLDEKHGPQSHSLPLPPAALSPKYSVPVQGGPAGYNTLFCVNSAGKTILLCDQQVMEAHQTSVDGSGRVAGQMLQPVQYIMPPTGGLYSPLSVTDAQGAPGHVLGGQKLSSISPSSLMMHAGMQYSQVPLTQWDGTTNGCAANHEMAQGTMCSLTPTAAQMTFIPGGTQQAQTNGATVSPAYEYRWVTDVVGMQVLHGSGVPAMGWGPEAQSAAIPSAFSNVVVGANESLQVGHRADLGPAGALQQVSIQTPMARHVAYRLPRSVANQTMTGYSAASPQQNGWAGRPLTANGRSPQLQKMPNALTAGVVAPPARQTMGAAAAAAALYDDGTLAYSPAQLNQFLAAAVTVKPKSPPRSGNVHEILASHGYIYIPYPSLEELASQREGSSCDLRRGTVAPKTNESPKGGAEAAGHVAEGVEEAGSGWSCPVCGSPPLAELPMVFFVSSFPTEKMDLARPLLQFVFTRVTELQNEAMRVESQQSGELPPAPLPVPHVDSVSYLPKGASGMSYSFFARVTHLVRPDPGHVCCECGGGGGVASRGLCSPTADAVGAGDGGLTTGEPPIGSGPGNRVVVGERGSISSSIPTDVCRPVAQQKQPHQLLIASRILIARIAKRVLMDRLGFFYAPDKRAVFFLSKYSAAIWSLPQEQRHLRTEWLPCTPLIVDVSTDVNTTRRLLKQAPKSAASATAAASASTPNALRQGHTSESTASGTPAGAVGPSSQKQ